MTPPYQIEALPAVEKDLDRLNPHIERRIVGWISALAANPRPAGAHPIAGKPGYYRIRVSDYRVVYGVDDRRALITIVIVGHRRDVYERMLRRISYARWCSPKENTNSAACRVSPHHRHAALYYHHDGARHRRQPMPGH